MTTKDKNSGHDGTHKGAIQTAPLEKGDVRRNQGDANPDAMKAKPGRSSRELMNKRNH